ncbi:uncharacterized protein DFL_001362 [Arthrobotrys flagrans]|uniref:Uncharacterized protein n=1 Tax=Arthrobotrys flagrans TaxID=97331 RepID=A0A437AH17_ARTFL|nr:hypothetical protein DFL_001362 [Arthrobotrys flagrans]
MEMGARGGSRANSSALQGIVNFVASSSLLYRYSSNPTSDRCPTEILIYLYATRVIPHFYHRKYKELSCYPSGGGLVEKSIVGLWVETLIFGGVVYFDRGKDGRQIHDIYLHSDNHGDNLYKVEKRDIISLLKRLSSANEMVITNLKSSGSPISILDAQNQGIYQAKNLADSNLYNILLVALGASGFQRYHRDTTEGPGYSPTELTHREYKGLLMTDDMARKIRARWMERSSSSKV